MNKHQFFRRTALSAALLAAFGPGVAAGDEVTEATKPDSGVDVGAGYVNKDNQRFGQYNGLNKQGGYGLLDFYLQKREEETGTWTRFTGRNVGLDSRELHFDQERQGNWSYSIDYNQIPRLSPYTVNTSLQGIGTNSVTQGTTASPKSDVELKTERDITTLGGEKWLGSRFNVRLSFRNEDKDGTRLWGGETGGNMAFIPEPINFNTRQLEATLGFIGEKLQLSGGYYGSMFTNNNSSLTITPAPASNLISPEPLVPGNQAHQAFLQGGYSFTNTTRGNFKVSYTRATQDEQFIFGNPTGTLLNNLTSPNARVDTTIAQFGVSARPMPKLSLLANFRYEDRADKTPETPFVTAGGVGLTNTVFSRITRGGKIEGSYQLPKGYRATLGVDVLDTDRTVPDVRIVSWRAKNDETTYRAELARSMSETVNGRLALLHSDRTGSDYLNNVKPGATYTTTLAPIIWADRTRDKARLTLDWMPTNPLSLQLIAEDGRDDYSGLPLGPQTGKEYFYSIDGTYVFSESFRANAWVSRNYTRMDQLSKVVNTTTVDENGSPVPNGTVWGAQLANRGDSAGLGVSGKPTGQLELGVNFLYQYDTTYQGMSLANGTEPPQLPDYYYKLVRVQVYGTHPLDKKSGVRLDVINDRRTTNDWLWTDFVYPQDGTTVRQDTHAVVTFVGVSYYYRFQ